MKKELIKIELRTIGQSEINAVDARELHRFLKVKSEFRNWIKNRIDKYDFSQGVDFIAGNFLPGSEQKDYYISMDMAKELAMVERNEKGKQARKYFIECERQLKSLAVPKDYLSALKALVASEEEKQAALERAEEAERTKAYISDKKTATASLKSTVSTVSKGYP